MLEKKNNENQNQKKKDKNMNGDQPTPCAREKEFSLKLFWLYTMRGIILYPHLTCNIKWKIK